MHAVARLPRESRVRLTIGEMAECNFARAAALYGAIGARPAEARAYALAAEHAAADRRPEEAARCAARALAVYRDVSAALYAGRSRNSSGWTQQAESRTGRGASCRATEHIAPTLISAHLTLARRPWTPDPRDPWDIMTAVTSAASCREVTVSDESIKRFADYSSDELARLLSELERGNDDRLNRLLAELRAEIARRSKLR